MASIGVMVSRLASRTRRLISSEPTSVKLICPSSSAGFAVRTTVGCFSSSSLRQVFARVMTASGTPASFATSMP